MGTPVGHWIKINTTRVYTYNFSTRESAQKAAEKAVKDVGPDWYATRPFEWSNNWRVYLCRKN